MNTHTVTPEPAQRRITMRPAYFIAGIWAIYAAMFAYALEAVTR